MNDARLSRLIESLWQVSPAVGVVHIFYFHDDDCPCHDGDRPLPECECDPWVQVHGKRYQVTADGELTPLPRDS